MHANGWKKATIGELCTFSSGHGFSVSDWSDEGWPIIRIQNLNGSRDFNYYAGVPEPSWIVEPGELLFAWAGVKGVSFGPTIWSGPSGLLNQHIYRIRPVKGVDPHWLYLQLQVVTRHIEASAHGFKANLVHVRKADITGQSCYLPDIEEQKRIAKVLSLWDASIRVTEDLLSAKLRLKQGMLQNLLTGKWRFAAFSPTRFVEYQIGEVLKVTHRPVLWDDEELYKLSSIRRHSGGLFWRESLLGRQIKVKKLHTIQEGDFLISHIQAAYGAMGRVPKEFSDGKVSDMYTILTPRDPVRVDMRFLDYLSQTRRMRHQAYLACNGFFAERLRLNFDPGEFLKQTILLPETIEEQRKIVDVLDAQNREIRFLEAQLQARKRQQKGLMQKLLAGEVRVRV